MVFIDCDVCADRYRRHWIGVVLAILLSPLFWAWAALAIPATVAAIMRTFLSFKALLLQDIGPASEHRSEPEARK